MAFLKFAKASIVRPFISGDVWDKIRSESAVFQKTAKVAQSIDLDNYMLSHATIMASVDTEKGPGSLGKHLVDKLQIDRRFQDYYITPETSQFVNNNGDAWSRQVLLASFRSFIGGHNYCEHLQIPELSKGRIVDAVARDTGLSLYIDILVATEKKHKPLIDAIESGSLKTMSMGCQVSHTQCTKCGNVAEDDTQLCVHVKYSKRNNFVDSLGKQRIIAELCGHWSEPNSVRFIEASWVENPAFTGAVVRNVLKPEHVNLSNSKVQVAFSRDVNDCVGIPKVAFEGDFEGAKEESKEEGAAKPVVDPMTEIVEDLAAYFREKAVDKVRKDIEKDGPSSADVRLDDTLIREASKIPVWQKIAKVVEFKVQNPVYAKKLLFGLITYHKGGWKTVKALDSFNNLDILALSRLLDVFNDAPKIAGEYRIYKTVMAVGSVLNYKNSSSYLFACKQRIGRDLTDIEKKFLLQKGRLLRP